jgi:hypothetical protein
MARLPPNPHFPQQQQHRNERQRTPQQTQIHPRRAFVSHRSIPSYSTQPGALLLRACSLCSTKIKENCGLGSLGILLARRFYRHRTASRLHQEVETLFILSQRGARRFDFFATDTKRPAVDAGLSRFVGGPCLKPPIGTPSLSSPVVPASV